MHIRVLEKEDDDISEQASEEAGGHGRLLVHRCGIYVCMIDTMTVSGNANVDMSLNLTMLV